MGCLIYIVFGSSKDVPMGPTAIASLLTFQVVNGKGPEHAILLCFLSGLIELLMGILGLGKKNLYIYKYIPVGNEIFVSGFLIDFVSGPVSSGFTSAVALIIISSQIKDLLGITTSGATFVDLWISVFNDIHNTKKWDTILGFICIGVLLIMRVSKRI